MSYEAPKKLQDAMAVVSAALVTREGAIKILGIHGPQYQQMVKAGTIALDGVDLFGRTLFYVAQVNEVAKKLAAKRAERAAKTGKTAEEKAAEKAAKAEARAKAKAEKEVSKAVKATEREAAKAAKAEAKAAADAAKAEAKTVRETERANKEAAKLEAKLAAQAAKEAARPATADPAPVPAPATPESTSDLAGKTIPELRAIAKEVGVSPVGSAEAIIKRIEAKRVAPATTPAPAGTVSLDDLLS
jgi:hypothetical protein